MMFCSKCGNEIQAEAKFCPKCGWQLGTSSDNVISDEWFYINNNVRCGPFRAENIQSLVQKGEISKETLVWKKGMLNWLPAVQTELVHIIRTAVPPMPSNIVSDKYAWTLATVPILISWFIESIGLPFWVVTICTISLNIIFLMLDSDELNKSGQNINNWMWMGVVLVPVYLFVRASKTKKKYGYAVMWCVMFFIDIMLSVNKRFTTQ